MLDFIKIKNDLESSFNRKKSEGVDVDININVINEDNGKFSVSVFNERCFVNNQHLPNALFFDLDKNSDENSDLPHMLPCHLSPTPTPRDSSAGGMPCYG